MLLCTLATRSIARATIDVFLTIVPNLLGPPNAGTWLTNTFNALYGGAASAGTVGSPGYYAVAPAVIPVDADLVTTIANWRGIANPGTAFGPDFAAEQGHRLLYSFVINAHGQQLGLLFAGVSIGFALWHGHHTR